jgi:hypothetical protein
VNRATESALRDLLAKAIDATVAADRMRALAALNHMHGLLAEPTVERESKAPPRQKRKPYRCADCTYVCKFPGQLEEHRRVRHPEIA